MRLLLLLLSILFLSACGRQYHFAATPDRPSDSSYVYALPYPKGSAHFLVQGYRSGFSHKGQLALDFKMPSGSPVTAAREGVVVRLQQDYTRGGASKKYSHKANLVVIRHSDGTSAYYGHLRHNGVLVNVGDSVKRGQLIARSGSTGNSAFPHLHFIVWGPNWGGGRGQLPTRFETAGGPRYLKAGRTYTAQ